MRLVVLLASLLSEAPARAANTAPYPNVDQSPKLPAGLKLTGRPQAARRWTDKRGENLLVLTETTRVGAASGGTKHLYGYQFLRAGQVWKPLWRIRDAVVACEFDLELELVTESLSVTDLDGDGTAETAFAYKKTCTSDVSPSELKVLMHGGAPVVRTQAVKVTEGKVTTIEPVLEL